jgi:hypothetical protein
MVSRIHVIAAAGAALLGMALALSPASATVSITNRDDKDHKLTVIEGDGATKTDHILKAAQVLEGICPQGCVIRLNDSEEDEYELEGSEVVSIEEGYLYYDGPDGPVEGQGAPPGNGPAPLPAPAPAPEKK